MAAAESRVRIKKIESLLVREIPIRWDSDVEGGAMGACPQLVGGPIRQPAEEPGT